MFMNVIMITRTALSGEHTFTEATDYAELLPDRTGPDPETLGVF